VRALTENASTPATPTTAIASAIIGWKKVQCDGLKIVWAAVEKLATRRRFGSRPDQLSQVPAQGGYYFQGAVLVVRRRRDVKDALAVREEDRLIDLFAGMVN
jgi:hypothetical protein